MANCSDVFAAFVKIRAGYGVPAAGCPYSRQYGFTACALSYFDERVEIGSGDAYPGRWLAINPGTAAGTLPGEKTVDPAFGLDAIWIESALKEQAQIQGFTVVEASTVVATHLNHLIGQFSAELFGRRSAATVGSCLSGDA